MIQFQTTVILNYHDQIIQNYNLQYRPTMNRFLIKFPFCKIKCNIPFKDYSNIINKIQVNNKVHDIPVFRMIGLDGKLISKVESKVDTQLFTKIYEKMIYTEEMDNILLMSKGQGKISFYMTSYGETASTVGSAAALQPQDWLYPQYREMGAFLWKGVTAEQFIDQCVGNIGDEGKGRQMPIHVGNKALNIVTVSSPLTTQVPQASGAGYAFRTQKSNKVAVAYFGQGAASEGDFHSAMNFAATLKCQTLFLCRNNKYAISTHQSQQYNSDGIAPRALGYNIATLRVDGNDALAVYYSVKYAREHILKHKQPFFIEFMTYRVGDHSTSDNSQMYRTKNEKQSWQLNNNPIQRLAYFLEGQLGHSLQTKEQELRKAYRHEVIETLKRSQKKKKHSPTELFEDVYDKLTDNLREQKEQLTNHLQKYADKYNLEEFQQQK